MLGLFPECIGNKFMDFAFRVICDQCRKKTIPTWVLLCNCTVAGDNTGNGIPLCAAERGRGE
jgi:hypothetical protein